YEGCADADHTNDDVDREDNLGGGDGEDEYDEDRAGDARGIQVRGEGDEVQADGVEHELHAHEDEHRVPPGEDAVDAKAEDNCAQDEVVLQRNHARTRPPAG